MRNHQLTITLEITNQSSKNSLDLEEVDVNRVVAIEHKLFIHQLHCHFHNLGSIIRLYNHSNKIKKLK